MYRFVRKGWPSHNPTKKNPPPPGGLSEPRLLFRAWLDRKQDFNGRTAHFFYDGLTVVVSSVGNAVSSLPAVSRLP